ncbi:MAG: hypothetical protein ACQESN_10990 [Thermotogota bacterium]
MVEKDKLKFVDEGYKNLHQLSKKKFRADVKYRIKAVKPFTFNSILSFEKGEIKLVSGILAEKLYKVFPEYIQFLDGKNEAIQKKIDEQVEMAIKKRLSDNALTTDKLSKNKTTKKTTKK